MPAARNERNFVRHFDHVLVGTGQATGTLIAGLTGRGESIAVIEGAEIGGTCVNTGCTPTKTLLASARTAHVARGAPAYGVLTGKVEIDFARVMARMNEIRHGSRDGLKSWLEGLDDVTLFRSWARFKGPRRLCVGEGAIEGERIYLNVGARAREPRIPGAEDVLWLHNRSILELTELPEHLVIAGGSYIGLELGQVFRRFGSRVTVIAPDVMPREDEDVAARARDILEAEGIEFRLGAMVEGLASRADGSVEVACRSDDRIETVGGSHVLFAIGRHPNVDRLDLEAAGIETDERGYIQVDDHLRTNVEGVFALGDVNGQGAFTHTSVNDAEILLDTLDGGPRSLSDRIPIYGMFIDPPLGRIGMTEREARECGHRVLKATREMKRISRAKEMGETDGFVKLLVDADTDLVLGVSILGVHGDEIINMFAAIMYSGIPCHEYRKVVLVHPTVSELMPWILDDLEPVD